MFYLLTRGGLISVGLHYSLSLSIDEDEKILSFLPAKGLMNFLWAKVLRLRAKPSRPGNKLASLIFIHANSLWILLIKVGVAFITSFLKCLRNSFLLASAHPETIVS